MKPSSETKNRRPMALSSKLSVLLLIVFIAVISMGIALTRDRLLKNAATLGETLAQSYAYQEQNRIDIYRMFMRLGTIYVKNNIEAGYTDKEHEIWLNSYRAHLQEMLGADIARPYAVINGRIIASIYWENTDVYRFEETDWYQKAVEAGGEMVFSDPYTDVVTGEPYITLSQVINPQGDIFAFDIPLSSFHAHRNKVALPEESCYYLYDTGGTLIYSLHDHAGEQTATTGGENAADPAQEESGQAQDAPYADRLYEEIQDGQLISHNAIIQDPSGTRQGVYYYTMDNGWLSVVTIPIASILQENLDNTMMALTAVSGILFLAIAILLFREARGNRQMRYVNDTLRILGDTYYAIYRIDYEAGTYRTIKSSGDVREILGEHGDYRHLLDTVREVVQDKTYREFEESFSLEHIRELISQKVYEFGGEYKRHFGDADRWVSIRIIYNEGLHLNEVLMCYRDVDAEKQKEISQLLLLQSTLDSMKRLVKQKSMFFSNMSHDMRTPLNAVIGLAELAQKNRDDREKVDSYLAKIEQSGKQLLNLINDVLDMSRLEQDSGFSLDYRPMDLPACVRSCAELFKEQAVREQKELTVTTEVTDAIVCCDDFRITQILNNLISNALKYSLPGAKIDVSLRELECRTGRGRYRLTVSDTGIGMSREFLDRLFEPFARETTFAPKNISGTGLGMPIVQSLVRQMSGEISVESELGKGSAFTIILPLLIARDDAPKEADVTGREAADAEKPSFTLEGKTILIAEDNEINMEIASEFLRSLGAELIEAWDGREALNLFSASLPGTIDAILMDMQMPNMDGCASCRAIRALRRPDAATVPIIAVTANAFAEDISETTKAGMNAHIAKPIDFPALIRLLESLTGSQK